ncbi:MAG: DUF6544 family protein [Gemmatimonadota bacterium]
MRRWARVAGATGGGIVVGAAAAVAVGTGLWQRAADRTAARLASGRAAPEAAVRAVSAEEMRALPVPVARYFARVLTPGQPPIRAARVEQEGEFRTGGADAAWSPFTAVQHFAASPPGFVWNARIRVAPFLSVRVRDGYVGGTGEMRARLAGLLPLVDRSGGPGLNAGALHRWLAEAVWLPTTLLPGRGVAWEAVDDSTARATLTDGGTRVSLDFTFSPEGEIVRAYTPARARDVDGTDVPTPWACRYRDYAWVDGVRIPMAGEVEWILPGGPLPYWRGRIVRVDYERAEQPVPASAAR